MRSPARPPAWAYPFLLLISVGCARRPSFFGFERDSAGGPPAGFALEAVGPGPAGRWQVGADSTAPEGGQVLVQGAAGLDKKKVLLALASVEPFTDGTVEARCKIVAGKWERTCGIVLRFVDLKNGYLVRADVIDGVVRLYQVKGGERTRVAEVPAPVKADSWFQLAVEARGSRFVVRLDGRPVLDVLDQAFGGPGRVGLWTKGDSVAHFDALTVRPLK